MTNKQIYQELARIAGYKCADDLPFIKTDKCLKSNLRHVQSHLRAVMEKIDYHRTYSDFGERLLARRVRAAQDTEMARAFRENSLFGVGAIPVSATFWNVPPPIMPIDPAVEE